MKRSLFTIAEGHFYTLVKHVISHLKKQFEKIAEPMIVGGLAVQIHIMDMILRAGMSPECSHFRKTDDIDLDFPENVSKKRVMEAMAELPPLETEVGDKLVFAEMKRLGEVKPIIELTVVGDGDENDEDVKLNISSGPCDLLNFDNDFHLSRYSRRVTVKFPHVSVEGGAEFPVVSLEDLIVTKAAGGREKDKKDLSNLAQVVNATKRKLNFDLMEESLNSVKDIGRKLEAISNYQEFISRLKRKGGKKKVRRLEKIKR